MRLPKETMEILEALAPELAESDDERIRRALINALKVSETIGELEFRLSEPTKEKAIAYLEKQKEASKAIEAVERIDKYIDEHVENAHDMKDSHPDKKYCQGIDDTLAGIAGILQDVYSNEKQKEQNDEECTDFVIYCPIKNGEGEYECIPYSFYGSLTSFSEDKDLIDFLRTCFYTEEECNEWIKRQKEQKPGEYLDKDKIYAIMKKLNDLSFSKDILINSKEYKQIDEITHDVRSLLDYPINQQPAEWSGEDNICWDEAFACVTRAKKTAKNEEELQSAVIAEKWLKEIQFKYYVHPVKPEWSEEDEEMFEALMHKLEVCDLLTNKEIMWAELRLKSFRPSWKSSEEQKYDGNMDKECIKLCDVLNSIPSVNTFESCCGHLKDRYSIWFFCNDTIAISRLGKSVERNYSDGKWELLVDSTDTHPTGVFWLRS